MTASTLLTRAKENGRLKVVSVLISVGLYSFTHGAYDAQRTILVGIVALSPPETQGRVLSTELPPQVRVHLRGPKGVLNELRPEELEGFQLDFRTAADKHVTLDPKSLRLPIGVKVESIEPSGFDLHWEGRVSRDIPILTSYVGTPVTGCVVKGVPAASPSTVRATGPESEIITLQNIKAEPFDVTLLPVGTHSRRLSLEKARGRVTFDHQNVGAEIAIVREMSVRTFYRLPVYITGNPKATAFPPEVDAVVSCPPPALRSLRPEQIVVRAAARSNVDHGVEELAVEVTLDECEVTPIPKVIVSRW